MSQPNEKPNAVKRAFQRVQRELRIFESGVPLPPQCKHCRRKPTDTDGVCDLCRRLFYRDQTEPPLGEGE